ncbi:MAG TPA: transglycosylase domain-containing protein [Acidimicrobiales bacterium]|nr:transglycosylase domain-containing protein [Acidimicrobiales bacterium]
MFALVAAGLFMLSRLKLPPPQPLKQTTFLYDSSGKQVLASFSEQNRVNVTLDQVPPVVVNAVVSTEDRHFWSEGALNPISIVRAAISDVAGGHLQGGSTITQQYVKQAYLSPKRTLLRKIKEAALAIRLSHAESKKQILQNYLNTIYWGRGAYGVQAASEAYFGKPVQQLGLPEASLLAALIREPESADPAHSSTLARKNQTDTLKAMVRDRKITRAQATDVEAMPFSGYVISASSGALAQTNGGAAGDEYFISAVRQQLYTKYGRPLVDGGGLRVTTTLDPSMQSQAYNSMYGQNKLALNPAKGEPSGALVSLDDNGAVKALVGGQNYSKSTVNLALGTAGGGSGRQAGSTFKAIMLAEVLREGYSAASVFAAPPEVVVPHGNANGAPWAVKNFEGETTAPALNLVDATSRSINTVYAQVVEKIGAANLDSMAIALGISPAEMAGAYPSQVLGTSDVSPLEMAAAFATFADGGVYHQPLLVTKVTKADGSPLPLPVQPQSRVVLTPSEAAQLDFVLQQVVLKGTGTAAGVAGSTTAGKTGTTEHSSDAWFIGFTPNLTTAVWMGYADSIKPMVDFRGYSSIQGGTIPAQLWHAYMASVLTTMPQYRGTFPNVSTLTGKILTPPAPGTLQFPLGGGAGAALPSPGSAGTTIPGSSPTTVVAGHPGPGQPSGTSPGPTTPQSTPASTSPPSTSPPTTRPTTITTVAG